MYRRLRSNHLTVHGTPGSPWTIVYPSRYTLPKRLGRAGFIFTTFVHSSLLISRLDPCSWKVTIWPLHQRLVFTLPKFSHSTPLFPPLTCRCRVTRRPPTQRNSSHPGLLCPSIPPSAFISFGWWFYPKRLTGYRLQDTTPRLRATGLVKGPALFELMTHWTRAQGTIA